MSFRVPPFPPNKDQHYTWHQRMVMAQTGSDMLISFEIVIPSWDMDADPSKTIALGKISYKSIKDYSIMIDSDTGDRYNANLVKDGISSAVLNALGLTITREADGLFDASGFSNTTNTRGLVIIWV